MAARRRTLIEAALAPATRRRYLRAVAGLLRYADGLGEDPADFTELDELACDYVHHLYENNKGRSTAASLLYGLKFFLPGAKDKLHFTTLAVRGWERLVPSVSHPPLTWDLCVAMAVKAAKTGHSLHGVAMLLQFDCLLRLSELIGLRRRHVVFEGDPRYSREFKGALLVLPNTKTGRHQSVTVEHPDVIRLLRRHCAALPNDESPVFPFRADAYRRIFHRVAASLGLSSRYVPHSCRHGGATRMYQRNPLSIEAIKVRGRWKATESAKRYIQQGVALLGGPAAGGSSDATSPWEAR